MRKLIFVLAFAIGLVFTASPAAFAVGDDQNCSDFASQAAAQAHLRADPLDPDGLDAHVGPADGDDRAGGDGIACEANDGPFDRRAAFAFTVATASTSAAALPSTGASWMLPAVGSVLVVVGMILLIAGRRPRRGSAPRP